jgi:hypothetical protein
LQTRRRGIGIAEHLAIQMQGRQRLGIQERTPSWRDASPISGFFATFVPRWFIIIHMYGRRASCRILKRSTLMLLLLLTTWAAMAAAFVWALAPFLTPMVYPYPSDWTEADLIRHVWPFHLVPPEWGSTSPDYMQWMAAEIKARLAVVFLGWLGGITFVIRRYIRSHKTPVPGRPAGAC